MLRLRIIKRNGLFKTIRLTPSALWASEKYKYEYLPKGGKNESFDDRLQISRATQNRTFKAELKYLWEDTHYLGQNIVVSFKTFLAN